MGASALAAPAPTPSPANAWSRLTTPASGPAEAIGFYSSGCLRGAVELTNTGTGYQSVLTRRNRHFAHPDLVSFIQNYSRKIDAAGSALLIADIAQIRGGPLPYGHASHQLGLDVDIWFWTHPEQRTRILSDSERNQLKNPSMLDANGAVDSRRFTREQILKLKTAATDPKVERIFVNPAIKRHLCATLETEELNWLHALRPWPGHDEHFHVRIRCPETSPACRKQDAVPPGDGCDDPQLSNSNSTASEPVSRSREPLPDECLKILKEGQA